MEYALEVSNLNKRLRGRQILSGININVGYGETLGLIGPNGAGKTSVIKCVMGLWHKDSGSVNICGQDLHRDFTGCMRNAAALIEYPKLFPNLTLAENVRYISSFYNEYNQAEADRLIALLGLSDSVNKKIKAFSSGMHQKACLLIVLLKKPKLLILDEPTSMLDPKSAAEIRSFLARLKADGISMLISSHNLHEVEKLCDKVLIIDKGKELNRLDILPVTKERHYVLVFENTEAAAAVKANAGGKYDLTHIENKLRFTATAARLQSLLAECGSIKDLYIDEKLEHDFLAMLENGGRGDV